MLKTGIEIMNDIQNLAGLEPAKLLDNQTWSSNLNETKNFINEILRRFDMPYTILSEATDTDGSIKWAVIPYLQPQKVYWDEKINLDDRGEALYQKICEPFKTHGGVFPKTLKDANNLFNLDPTICWELSFYRNWLLMINKGYLSTPKFNKLIQDVIDLTAKYPT